MKVLMVCSANRCRSPMAAALLAAAMAERGMQAEVTSAGFGPPGQPAVPEAVAVMAEVRLDLGDHRSRRVGPEMCEGSDLVVGMTRQHLVELVVASPSTWPRSFVLRDLLDRGRQIGPRRPGEEPEEWIRRAHGGRQRAGVLALAAADDIVDPIGGPRADFERTRRDLSGLLGELAALLAPLPAPEGAR